MHLNDFRSLLVKRSQEAGFEFDLAGPAEESALRAFRERLNQDLPQQVERFYRANNGLIVPQPSLVILPVEQLVRTGDHVHFATVGGTHRLGFDVSTRNAADQWDIIDLETRQLVTLTMASFWSNKLWAWLLQGREIWKQTPTESCG